ncbi:MAG TPA: hypothetical protein VFS12_15790, partial [Terriglobia bacterium]|nr:hypothetical protein [Terriglobia bacterium]
SQRLFNGSMDVPPLGTLSFDEEGWIEFCLARRRLLESAPLAPARERGRGEGDRCQLNQPPRLSPA